MSKNILNILNIRADTDVKTDIAAHQSNLVKCAPVTLQWSMNLTPVLCVKLSPNGRGKYPP